MYLRSFLTVNYWQIKFVVDGHWRTDPDRELVTRGAIENNVLRVERWDVLLLRTRLSHELIEVLNQVTSLLISFFSIVAHSNSMFPGLHCERLIADGVKDFSRIKLLVFYEMAVLQRKQPRLGNQYIKLSYIPFI